MKRIWIFALALLMLGSVLFAAPENAAAADTDCKADDVAAFVARHMPEPEKPDNPEASDGVILFRDENGELTEVVPVDDAEETARGNIGFNSTNFPDPVFRQLLIDTFGKNYMTQEQADKVESIDVTGMGIGTMRGVEFFKNLDSLLCGSAYDEYGNKIAENHIAELDVSKNEKLDALNCNGNQITKLAANTGIRTLYCSDNRLSGTFDISGYRNLSWFDCAMNDLTGIRFPETGTISDLDCSDNRIAEFDFRDVYVHSLNCRGNLLTELHFPQFNCPSSIYCDNNRIREITGLRSVNNLSCMNNELTELVFTEDLNWGLNRLYCMNNRIERLVLNNVKYLEELMIGNNLMESLDLSVCESLRYLDCSYNLLRELDVHVCERMKGLACVGNGLLSLDLANNTKLEELYCYGQAVAIEPLTATETGWMYDGNALGVDFSRVSAVEDANYTLSDGVFAFEKAPSRFTYLYDTQSLEPMDVTLFPPYAGKATVKWTDSAMQYKGATPYMLYDGKAKTPAFAVYDEDGEVILPLFYTYAFAENTLSGTAYLSVRMLGTDSAASAWFKIYLPASQWLRVENVAEGVRLEWAPVEGAAGYVVYRRAWSTTTNGWTSFERWWNVTETTWTDGTIEGHKVYAGTRYQYGVKAYFERRVDPITGEEIGGNVNEPSGNYNLGLVGPLKTTVRITTRTLQSVTPGTKQLTAKWSGSKVFTGYEVRVSLKKDFSDDVRTVRIDNPKTYETTVRGLLSGEYYFVQVRSYQEFEGMTYFGQWSNTLYCKVR